MILEHKKLYLYGKKVFEMMVVQPPMTKFNLMENEACFLHVIEGKSTTISEIEKTSLNSQESVLMKCGSYISNMQPTKNGNYFHSFTIHFHVEVLKDLYKNETPDFLKNKVNVPVSNFKSVENKELITTYIDGIMP